MKKYLLILSFALIFSSSQVIAQRPCHTDEYTEYLRTSDPTYDIRENEKREAIKEYFQKNPDPTPHAIITIPVVFHVVWQTSAQNLPDACLIDQIASLNRDFRKLNTDITLAPSQYQSIAADVEFEFCLATKDPQGNPTNGIVRKQTTSTFGVNDNIKFTSSGGTPIWDKNKYLNIWIGEIGSVGGFSPKGCSSSSTDGVVIHWAEVGNCDKISNGDQGRTAVHEVGHWMGLSHTFQGGCSGMTASDCATGGDYVCDTPPVAQQSFSMNCSLQSNTCSESPNQIDMIWNHMDYTHPACKVMFTAGQKALMYASSSNCRSNIFNGTAASSVCSPATGTNEITFDKYFSVFPNPSGGEFNLISSSSDKMNVEIQVYNLLGTVVFESISDISHGAKAKIDFSPQPQGLYFIEVKSGNEVARKKIIIAR